MRTSTQRTWLIAALVTVWTAGSGSSCTESVPDPTEAALAVPLNEIVDLTPKDATVLADGVEEITLSVQIPANAASRQVTFETELGSFGEANDKLLKIVKPVNEAGVATAVLRAGIEAAPDGARIPRRSLPAAG